MTGHGTSDRQGIDAALIRVTGATTLVVLSFSMLNPVLAVRLQTAGASASAIGLFAMLPFLSVALMVPLMPAVFDRFGVARAYRWGLALEALATLGYATTEHYLLWCALAAVGGVGAAAAWNGTEALIAHNAPPDRRGRYTGLYQTALGGALAVGPFLPGVLPLTPRALTVLAAVFLLMAIVATLSPGVSALRAGRVGAVPAGLWATLCAVPSLAALAFAGGVFEAGLASITSAYGSQTGLSLAAAASLAGAMGVGSLLLQYPCGWLSDHAAARRVFFVAGIVLLAASAGFAAARFWTPLLWICAVLWGGVGGALYTLTMIRVAHRFAHASAVAATAAMITGYTAGGAAGPSLSGLMLDQGGATGMSLWLCGLSLAVIALSRRFEDHPRHA